MKIKNIIINIFMCIPFAFFVSIAIKGNSNFMYFQNNKDTVINGPYETSNNSSRYALTESIVVNKSFFLNEELAKFSSPDLSKINGKYISIFTPGISFAGIPFYYLGSLIGIPQIGAYLLSTFLSLLNVYLIYLIVRQFKLNSYIALLSGSIFIFATNAFSYSNSFNQHHASTFLLLLSILLSFRKVTLTNNIIFGMVYGTAIIVDIPNIFLILPVLINQIVKNITLNDFKDKYDAKIKIISLGLIIGLLPLLFVFGWYNYKVTNDPLKLGQVYGRHIYSNSKTEDLVVIATKKDKKEFKQFDSRRILNGLGVLLISKDRGIIMYSPVLIFALLGMYIISSQNSRFFKIFFGIIIMNVLLYSLFNDPWGGWAFGTRYLIPSSAIMSILIAFAIERYSKKVLFTLLFLITMVYSVAVNTLGAITTQLVPSSIQLPFLPRYVSDNFMYNYSLLTKGQSTSLIYNTLIKDHIDLSSFVLMLIFLIVLFILSLYFANIINRKDLK